MVHLISLLSLQLNMKTWTLLCTKSYKSSSRKNGGYLDVSEPSLQSQFISSMSPSGYGWLYFYQLMGNIMKVGLSGDCVWKYWVFFSPSTSSWRYICLVRSQKMLGYGWTQWGYSSCEIKWLTFYDRYNILNECAKFQKLLIKGNIMPVFNTLGPR